MEINILELLKTRRSHYRREFTGEKVDDKIIDYLLECAHQAPTHKMTMPWHFKVFTGAGLQKLSDKILEIHNQENPEADESDSKIVKIKTIPDDTSHIIAICMKRDKMERIPEIEEVCATTCAMENIYIGLLNFEDVGGYYSTGNKIYTKQMHEFMNLGEKDKLLGLFFIGKLKNKRTNSNRPPKESHIEWFG